MQQIHYGGSVNNGDVNKSRMGNTVNSGEHVEDIKTGENMNLSKDVIKETTKGNTAKTTDETNTKEKVKRNIRN